MKVVVLGTGRLARFRTQALVEHPSVGWVGVGSASADRARAAETATGAHASGSRADMLQQSPDAIVVANASSGHAELIRSCLDHQVPILCEKPIATDLADAQALAAAADKATVTLQVGFQRRFDAGFRAAHDSIAAGQLGTVYSIRLASHDHRPPPASFVTTSGGMFRDLHVHDFDIARWLTGDEVDEVYTVAAARADVGHIRDAGDVDTTGVLLRMRSGLPVVITGARHDGAGHDVRAEVFGSADTITMGLDARTPLTPVGDTEFTPPQRPYVDYLDRFEHAFRAETAAFIDVVRGDRDNPCPATEGLAALRVAIAAERSHHERRPIAMAEVTG